MGALEFENVIIATDAQAAFDEAHEQAAWEHGHGGYTGTIAEKGDYVMIRPPEGVSGWVWAELVMAAWDDDYLKQRMEQHEVDEKHFATARDDFRKVSDKWGPAGCIALSDDEAKRQIDAWLTTAKATGTFEINERTGVRARVGPEPTAGDMHVFLFIGWASS